MVQIVRKEQGSTLPLVLILFAITGIAFPFAMRTIHDSVNRMTVLEQNSLDLQVKDEIQGLLSSHNQCRRNFLGKLDFNVSSQLESLERQVSRLDYFNEANSSVMSFVTGPDQTIKSLHLENFRVVDSNPGRLKGDLIIQMNKDASLIERKPLVVRDISFNYALNGSGTRYRLSSCAIEEVDSMASTDDLKVILSESGNALWTSVARGAPLERVFNYRTNPDLSSRVLQATGECKVRGVGGIVSVDVEIFEGRNPLMILNLCQLASGSNGNTSTIKAGQLIDLPTLADRIQIKVQATNNGRGAHWFGGHEIVLLK